MSRMFKFIKVAILSSLAIAAGNRLAVYTTRLAHTVKPSK